MNTYSIIGEVYTPAVTDNEGNVTQQHELIPGWHVITTAPLVNAAEHIATTPPRVFAGVDTHYYIFADEAQCKELLHYDTTRQTYAPEYVEDVVAKRALMKCEALQFRRALRQLGKIDAVKSYIDTSDEETQEAWEFASNFRRMDPLVVQGMASLGVDDEEVDAVFELAVTL